MPPHHQLTVKAFLAPWISRSVNISKASIAVPFLYQTRTIHIARTRRPQAVPFPGQERAENALPDAAVKEEKPTRNLTEAEKKVFAKLQSTDIKEPKKPRPTKVERKEQLAEKTGDKKRLKRHLKRQQKRDNAEDEGADSSPATLVEAQGSSVAEQEGASLAGTIDLWNQSQKAIAAQIEKRIAAAKTDIELWKVLETKVFSLIAALDLDEQQTNSTKPGSQPTIKKEHHKKILAKVGHLYPVLMVNAVMRLRYYFPASSIPFMILPRIKELGRSSYALGAGTALYNQLIILYKSFDEFQAIDDLLLEMENGGINYDAQTLEELNRIRRYRDGSYAGRNQGILAQVLAMEGVAKGLDKLENWRTIIRNRLREEDERLALQQAAVLPDVEDVNEDIITTQESVAVAG